MTSAQREYIEREKAYGFIRGFLESLVLHPDSVVDSGAYQSLAKLDLLKPTEPVEFSTLGLIADIRAAVGDPEGRLMQDELVDRCRALACAATLAHPTSTKTH